MITDGKNTEILRQKTSWVSLVWFVVDTSNIIWEISGFRHENPENSSLGYGAARRTLLQSGRTGVVNCCTFSQWKHHHQIQQCLLCNNVLLPVSCVCCPGKPIIRRHKRNIKRKCFIYMQGVTGGMCETSGECSLGQTITI